MNILAVGDSWLSENWIQNYGTGGGLVKALRPLLPGATWNNIAVAGYDTVQMLECDRFDALVDGLRSANKMLISSGGDSITGPWMREFIRTSDDVHGWPYDALDRDTLAAMLVLIAALYNDLLDTRDKINPACQAYAVNYAMPYPDGRGVDILWGAATVAGPWLKPSLDDCGWTDPNEARAIVGQIMAAFNATLLDIQAKRKGFTVIDTASIPLARQDWLNELHLTPDGWNVAASFVAPMLA